MAKPTFLVRAIAVISVLIIHPLLITSHTLLRKRSDDSPNNSEKFVIKDDYISPKILTKLLPSSNNNVTYASSSSSSSAKSPMVCIPQEKKLKACFEKLQKSFNEVKCTQCIYGNVNPSTQVITCPHAEYCSSVAGCIESTCPMECTEEFYTVLNCIWGEEGAGCTTKSAGVGDGECGVANKVKKKKKKSPRSGTAATIAATTTTTTATKTTEATAAGSSGSKADSNPCSECSTSKGGARHNFCGNLNVNVNPSSVQDDDDDDVCSTQTECSNHGLKCQVCTKIVKNDGYGGETVVEDVGSGAYICVKDDDDEGGDKGDDDTKAAAPAAGAKAATTVPPPTTSSSKSDKEQQKGVTTSTTTTTTTSTTSTTPAATRNFCTSRAQVLGECMFSKDTSPNCLKCIESGTHGHSPNPTCQQVQKKKFCTNIAKCANEHCGQCKFEFYAGLNCALQKIQGCQQFSCAIGGGGIEGAIGVSSSGSGHDSDDEYTLQQFQDDVEKQLEMMNPRKEEEEVVVIEEA